MQAELSIPNPMYETANRLAQQLGMSLSEFVTAALTAYITNYRQADLTAQLNQIYVKESSALEPDVLNLQMASLPQEDWS